MLKLKVIIYLITILILISCEIEQKSNTNKLETIKSENTNIEHGLKKYYQNDSVEFINFNQNKNQLNLRLIFNKKIDFNYYFQDLEKALLKAKIDNIKISSTKIISMNFFSHFEEIATEFSLINEIQKELINQIKEERRLLNHKLIGENLYQSKSINRIVKLLGVDSSNINRIYVEKCRTDEIETENSKTKIRYKLNCAHLYVYLN